jgi:putative hydroxymethylpyrimidine transport system permease protein
VASADALARADRDLLDLYRSLHASRARTLLDVELPAALPAVFSGLRVAAAFAVVGAVFGEWVGSTGGLGYLLLISSNRLQTDLVLACVVVLAALALALVGACTLAERALTPWRRP